MDEKQLAEALKIGQASNELTTFVNQVNANFSQIAKVFEEVEQAIITIDKRLDNLEERE